MKLASSGARVEVRKRDQPSVDDEPSGNDDPRAQQLLTAAVAEMGRFRVSAMGSFFEAWSAACHDGDLSYSGLYEACAATALELTDASARVPLKNLLVVMARVCGVAVYLWETRDLIPSVWAPDELKDDVVLLRSENGAFSAVFPSHHDLGATTYAIPSEFSACVPRGPARAPEAWGKSVFQSTAVDDSSSEATGEQQLRDILYPSLDTGCGCIALLKATVKVAELAPTKRYLGAGFFSSCALLAFAVANLVLLDEGINPCCDSAAGRCRWTPDQLNHTNASMAVVCAEQLCAPTGPVLSAAYQTIWRGAPTISLGGTSQFFAGAAVVSALLTVAVALLATRSVAVQSQRVVFAEALRAFRVIATLGVLAISLWYLVELIRVTGAPRTISCGELSDDARLRCRSLTPVCAASLSVAVGPEARGQRELIAVAACLSIVCVVLVSSTLLPARPSDEVITELRGASPDISVFRVNAHCPDGPTQQDTAALQRDIYMRHFDGADWSEQDDEQSIANDSAREGDGSHSESEGDGKQTKPTLSISTASTSQASESSDTSRRHDGHTQLSLTDVKRRLRTESTEHGNHVVMPSVNAAIDRIAYRVSRTTVPHGQPTEFPRPAVDALVSTVDQRRFAQK